MHSKGVGSGYYHTYVQAQKLQKKKSYHTKQCTAENVMYFSGYLILWPIVYCLDV